MTSTTRGMALNQVQNESGISFPENSMKHRFCYDVCETWDKGGRNYIFIRCDYIIRKKLPYSKDETSESNTGTTDLSYQELNCRQVSVSDGSDTVSFTQRSTVNSITRRSSRIAVYRKNEIQNSSIIPLTNTKRAARDSVRTIGTETSRLCSYSTFQDEQLICTSSLSNITTVRRSLRISRMRKDDAGRLSICSPSNVTTVRRSERLSLKLQTQDESRKMIPLQTSTVCRSLRPSSSSARHTDMTFKLSPSKVLAAGGRRRRSARLSGKPPAYSDETVERLSSLRRVHKLSFKPGMCQARVIYLRVQD
ncbi:uncharacterized protein [Periplaneta americana]|uniref:uncharacterized protein isoform X2 n=1 Tax=Periplaneta americana TaxID=6978 RepID=UPI0037E7FEE8